MSTSPNPRPDPVSLPGLSINAESLEAQVAGWSALTASTHPRSAPEMNRPLADPTAAFLEQSEAALSTLTHDRYVRGIVSERNYLEAAEALRAKDRHSPDWELAAPLPELPEGRPGHFVGWSHHRGASPDRGNNGLWDHGERGKSGDYDPERISITWR